MYSTQLVWYDNVIMFTSNHERRKRMTAQQIHNLLWIYNSFLALLFQINLLQQDSSFLTQAGFYFEKNLYVELSKAKEGKIVVQRKL